MVKRKYKSASLPQRPYDRMVTAFDDREEDKKRKKNAFKNRQKNKSRTGPRRGSPQ